MPIYIHTATLRVIGGWGGAGDWMESFHARFFSRFLQRMLPHKNTKRTQKNTREHKGTQACYFVFFCVRPTTSVFFRPRGARKSTEAIIFSVFVFLLLRNRFFVTGVSTYFFICFDPPPHVNTLIFCCYEEND